MGCCISRSTGPNSPYPGGGPNASARAINPPPLSLPESVQSSNQASQPRRRRRDQAPLDQHITKPLRRHRWTSKDRRWTRRQLDRERADFFDTRVTGRAEVWQTIHVALQVMWDPSGSDAQEDGPETDGLVTAQTILSAAEISLPTGDLANGVYDSLGNLYQLPEWVVSDPDNLFEDGDGDGDGKGELSTAADDTAGEDDDDPLDTGRGDRGKAAMDVRERVNVRARLSENGRDFQVSISQSETVRNVAKKIAQEAALLPTKKIRMAYMGKILKENATLEAQGWQVGHVVNALVFDTQ